MIDDLETLARVIEQAARAARPNYGRMFGMNDEDYADSYGQPGTLEEFVNNTYIGEKGADEVFRTAAIAAATAVMKANL